MAFIFTAVVGSSIKESIRISGATTEHADWHYEMDVETWQKNLFACELDAVEGLRKYVQAWCGEDRLVLQWMQGEVQDATSALLQSMSSDATTFEDK